VNDATVLIQIDGLNILTDLIYAERAGPVSWMGPRRVRPPGIKFQDLPKIHAVLVSHDHYDHMCLETLKRLFDRDQPVIYTGLRNGELLEDAEIGKVKELDRWQSESLAESVSITFVPAQHFSSRGICDRFETLWGGFVIAGEGGRIYFAGDTGPGPHFEDISTRLGPPASTSAVCPLPSAFCLNKSPLSRYSRASS
jgi:L-ascorbate metabolism protein UlaG (beta-lactamase superfamily)